MVLFVAKTEWFLRAFSSLSCILESRYSTFKWSVIDDRSIYRPSGGGSWWPLVVMATLFGDSHVHPPYDMSLVRDMSVECV